MTGPEPDQGLTACDREPIHLPGAIQPHGVLLAVGETDLIIRQASDNCAAHIGADASALIGEPLAAALGSESIATLRAALTDPRASGTDPLVLTVREGAWEATWHRSDGLVVVELVPSAPTTSAVSTLFQDTRHAMEALQAADGVQALCDTAAAEVKRLTGYDRVMVYRFHADDHGEVVAEALQAGLAPYLGLHYPASDIPRQARRLYTLNPLGVIADVAYEPVALVGDPDALDRGPLDLSFAGLRSVSPFHLAYLRTMGAKATLTVSLMHGTRLWGMVTCHHHAGPRRIDAQLRAACRLLAQLFGLQLAVEEDRERRVHGARLSDVGTRLIARMSGDGPLAGLLADCVPSPLELVGAEGMVARIDGAGIAIGTVPPAETVEALLAGMRAQDDPSILVCDELVHRFGALEGLDGRTAGVLAVTLSPDLEDVVLWFRGERLHTVTWGGDPDKPMSGDPAAAPGTPEFAALGPRTSFEAWAQEIRGRSRPWVAAELDAARGLAAAIPDLLLTRAREDLARLALYDVLTGLPNRALLVERAERALEAPQRTGRRVALLFVDLDRFKAVNDSLGHAAGDRVLRQAAERLELATRESDTVARLGGDEFVVLCRDIAPMEAERLAQRIVRAFQVPFATHAHDATVTASVGVVLAEAGATPADLLHDADTAMYRAKYGGRNSAAPFTAEMRTSSNRRLELETKLGPALDRGDLVLHYQPIHTVTGSLTGFEALARWPVEGHEAIDPDEFIPVAEETGAIAPLTAWALDEGVRELAGWRREWPALDLSLSVNISASQVTGSLGTLVAAALSTHAVPPGALCLEITEGALVSDNELTRRLLHRLRDQGVQLSIDDFGTGYSSLAYLVRLPVHELKIDRAFISGLPARRSDATVVASVVGLAHQLGIRALAEGVETDEQLASARLLGCDLAQGYLLGRPVGPEAVRGLLHRAAGRFAA